MAGSTGDCCGVGSGPSLELEALVWTGGLSITCCMFKETNPSVQLFRCEWPLITGWFCVPCVPFNLFWIRDCKSWCLEGGVAGMEQVYPSLLELLKHKKCSQCNFLMWFDFTQCCVIAVGVIKSFSSGLRMGRLRWECTFQPSHCWFLPLCDFLHLLCLYTFSIPRARAQCSQMWRWKW